MSDVPSADGADTEGISSAVAASLSPGVSATVDDAGADAAGTPEYHKPALHLRISTQMYAGIAVPLLLTLLASLIAWIAFSNVGEAEQEVTQDAIPELDAALGVAEASNRLVAGGPRLTAAAEADYPDLVAEIAAARTEFEAQLEILWDRGTGSVWLGEMRRYAALLGSNIEAIEAEMPEYFGLLAQADGLRAESFSAIRDLEREIIPAIDDQLFFLIEGRRELWTPPEPPDVHRADSEVLLYRRLSALSGDVSQAEALLVSAFGAATSALIEPLRESFESARDRIEINVAALDAADNRELRPALDELISLGLGDGGVFDVMFRTRQIEENQRSLLAQNQGLGIDLVNEIEALVASVQSDVDQATAASSQAVSTGRLLLIVISVAAVVIVLAISWLYVGRRVLRRVNSLSDRMRALAGGDLEAPVDTSGRDEVSQMADALEHFRLSALEVQRLNLVETLAGELRERNEQLSTTLADLDRAQDTIVANEKLAALGEVTAGVAHEIRNPLNFVKNFAESSTELLDELLEAVSNPDPPADQAEYLGEITGDLKENLSRIRGHGDRANSIVESMLMMGRGGGETRPVDINALVEEHAMLSYHSARAQDPDFNITIEREFDPAAGELEVIPQDMGRVFLNLVANAGYAANQRWKDLGGAAGETVMLPDGETPYFPTIWLKTRRLDDAVLISVRDNGIGMPPDVVQRVFEPFYTTKPTGEGTGLGLAMSSDIVRGHGGQLTVTSEPQEFTEFEVRLPLVPVVAPEVAGTSGAGTSGAGTSGAGPAGA